MVESRIGSDGNIRVCIRDRETGRINREQYYMNGKWAKDGDHDWQWAVKMAWGVAKEIGGSVGICYCEGPVVGGVWPTNTENGEGDPE